jgi:hypothetical protein
MHAPARHAARDRPRLPRRGSRQDAPFRSTRSVRGACCRSRRGWRIRVQIPTHFRAIRRRRHDTDQSVPENGPKLSACRAGRVANRLNGAGRLLPRTRPERAGILRFQVLEEAVNRLVLRIDPSEGDFNQVAPRVEQCIRDFCAELGAHVTVRTDARPPQPDPSSGKLRQVRARRTDASPSPQ